MVITDDKCQSDTSDIVVSYEPEISEDVMPATLDISYDYATMNEIEENEKRRAKKSQSRGLSKSIQNALKPLRKSSKKKNSKEEQDLGEMGFRPAHRSNPLSKLKKHSDKDKTPATPPPTPATNSSGENSKETHYMFVHVNVCTCKCFFNYNVIFSISSA